MPSNVSVGPQSGRTQGGLARLPITYPGQQYDGVNEAVSDQQMPQRHPDVQTSLDRLYARSGRQPYPQDTSSAIYDQ